MFALNIPELTELFLLWFYKNKNKFRTKNLPKPEFNGLRFVLQKGSPFSSDRIYDRFHFIWSEGERLQYFPGCVFIFSSTLVVIK